MSVRFELAPSPALAAAIVAAHAFAAAGAWLALGGLAGAALAAALLCLGLATAWRRALLRGPGAVRCIEVGAEASRGRRYVARHLVILPIGGATDGPGGRTVLVTADMLPAAEFRRLRIWALWDRLPAVAPSRTISRPGRL